MATPSEAEAVGGRQAFGRQPIVFLLVLQRFYKYRARFEGPESARALQAASSSSSLTAPPQPAYKKHSPQHHFSKNARRETHMTVKEKRNRHNRKNTCSIFIKFLRGVVLF